jgi:hypothetical protein
MEGSKLTREALKLPFVIDKATARPGFFMRANYGGQIMSLKRPGSNPADTLPVIMQYLEAQREAGGPSSSSTRAGPKRRSSPRCIGQIHAQRPQFKTHNRRRSEIIHSRSAAGPRWHYYGR